MRFDFSLFVFSRYLWLWCMFRYQPITPHPRVEVRTCRLPSISNARATSICILSGGRCLSMLVWLGRLGLARMSYCSTEDTTDRQAGLGAATVPCLYTFGFSSHKCRHPSLTHTNGRRGRLQGARARRGRRRDPRVRQDARGALRNRAIGRRRVHPRGAVQRGCAALS
jgi:hypothetical protein